MMSCASRITIQSVAVDGIRSLYAQRGWFLGTIAQESRIVRCSESVASEQNAWRVCSALRQLGVADDESVSGFGSDVVVLAKSVRMSCGVLEARGNCASVTDGT